LKPSQADARARNGADDEITRRYSESIGEKLTWIEAAEIARMSVRNINDSAATTASF
jgi:hypothetical protein